MKDLYSFDVDEAGLDVSYQKMMQAYQNIYARCGLPTDVVEADSGAIGGKDSQEFMVVAETGEDEIIILRRLRLRRQRGKGAERQSEGRQRRSRCPTEEVATPGMETIEEVAGFLKMPPQPDPQGGLLQSPTASWSSSSSAATWRSTRSS